jgi:polar amino acid transport system permease protein
VRAGILSVDHGQEEAATALGMSWFQTMAAGDHPAVPYA